MSRTANVQSIDALAELRSALVRFRGEAEQSLAETSRAIDQTREWLRDRMLFWQCAVEEWMEKLQLARRALEACMNSGDRDNPPSCDRYEEAVVHARRMLAIAEEELLNVQRWTRVVEEAIANYERPARAFADQVGNGISSATASLAGSIASLDAYTALQAPARLSSSVSDPINPYSAERIVTSIAQSVAVGAAGLVVAGIAALGALRRAEPARFPPGTPRLAATDDWSLSRANALVATIPSGQHGFTGILYQPHAGIVVLEDSQAGPDDAAMRSARIATLEAERWPDDAPTTIVIRTATDSQPIVYTRDPLDGTWRTVDLPMTSIVPAAPGEGPRDIQDVALNQIDLSDSPIAGEESFRKVSYATMLDGLLTLDREVRPAVLAGADGDTFSALDAELGLDPEFSYRRIYDAFYGDSAIHLDRRGDRFEVLNGYHRLYIAGQLGWTTIPARIDEPPDISH